MESSKSDSKWNYREPRFFSRSRNSLDQFCFHFFDCIIHLGVIMVINAHLNNKVVFFFRQVFTVSDNCYCIYTQNIIMSPREGDQWQIADLSPKEVKGGGREREVTCLSKYTCQVLNDQLLICVFSRSSNFFLVLKHWGSYKA